MIGNLQSRSAWREKGSTPRTKRGKKIRREIEGKKSDDRAEKRAYLRKGGKKSTQEVYFPKSPKKNESIRKSIGQRRSIVVS